jgi:serine/threonine/tyrosine-interacting protein
MYVPALKNVQGLLPPDQNWVYTKKRESQEILPGLWLGPFGSAKELTFLQEAGITDVLVVRAPEEARILKPKYPDRCRYEVLECVDSPFESLLRFFPDTKRLIDSVLQNGGRMLIHGNAGMSRSAAIVIAYVMQTFGLAADTAHQYVLTRRHCISINEGFRNQLREYEMMCRVHAQVQQGVLPAQCVQHGVKRALEPSTDEDQAMS